MDSYSSIFQKTKQDISTKFSIKAVQFIRLYIVHYAEVLKMIWVIDRVSSSINANTGMIFLVNFETFTIIHFYIIASIFITYASYASCYISEAKSMKLESSVEKKNVLFPSNGNTLPIIFINCITLSFPRLFYE